MDWIIGSVALITGLGIGVFIGKFLFEPKKSTVDEVEKNKTEKQVIAEQTNLHVTETQAALNKIQEQCHLLTEQLNHYQGVINETTQEKEANQLEYFNQQASLHLKTQKREAKKVRKTDYQPLDYSEGQSGLFAGDAKKHSETS